MRIDLVTLFPELFAPLLSTSLLGKAVEAERIQVRMKSPRAFGIGRHLKVDDTPYGGGSGMVMRVDCVVACMEAFDAEPPGPPGFRILLTPQGERLRQPRLIDLAAKPALTLVCGRYEGFDERVRAFVDLELSLGDFVLAGGEIAAMAVLEGVARLLPGVLGNEASVTEESHSPTANGLLEYPQYTRPFDYRGQQVPEVLISGNHAAVARWRETQSVERTAQRRPDLMPHVAPAESPEGLCRTSR